MSSKNKCQAKDPSTCPYHGAIIREEKALQKLGKNVSEEALEEYFQARKQKEQETFRKQEKRKERILNELNQVIDEEFIKYTYNREKETFIDKYHIVRDTNQNVRYILEHYRKAYGKSYELEVATKKLSTIYQMSGQAGYKHGELLGDTYEDPKQFYPLFREGIEMLKDPNVTERDIANFREKVGLCQYGLNHIQNYCGGRCEEDSKKYVTYDLPKPTYF